MEHSQSSEAQSLLISRIKNAAENYTLQQSRESNYDAGDGSSSARNSVCGCNTVHQGRIIPLSNLTPNITITPILNIEGAEIASISLSPGSKIKVEIFN